MALADNSPPPISSHILGVAHLCHAEKMEFLVTAINEINQFGTCEPTVNQQVIEMYLVALRIASFTISKSLTPLLIKYSSLRLAIWHFLSRLRS